MMPSTGSQFDLLRHGQVDGPAALYGTTDVELSAQGWHNVRHQVSQLKRPKQLISSPLKRCRMFAQILAQEWQLPLHIEPELREFNFGLLDGIPFDQLHEHWPHLEAFGQNPFAHHLPQAETLADFNQRIANCWQKLTEKFAKQQNLVICHGGVIRQILAQLLPVKWQEPDWYSQLQVPYASLSRITIADYENAKPVIQFIAKPASNEAL
jgi:alpha-ribazole phosphatase